MSIAQGHAQDRPRPVSPARVISSLRSTLNSDDPVANALRDSARRMIGVAVLESKLIGDPKDMLQLKFLHVSQAYRGRGLGRQLFEHAKAVARARGAQRMYVSATPSEHTINFYLGLGCLISKRPDPALLALEPDDIHLEIRTG